MCNYVNDGCYDDDHVIAMVVMMMVTMVMALPVDAAAQSQPLSLSVYPHRGYLQRNELQLTTMVHVMAKFYIRRKVRAPSNSRPHVRPRARPRARTGATLALNACHVIQPVIDKKFRKTA